MVDIISREWIYFWYYFSIQFGQIFRYWVLGMVLGSAVSVFFKESIHGMFRALGERKLGVVGIFAASALGIASPLCMYGTIPIAASFSKSGMKDDWLAAFMMCSILLNPQLMIYSAALGRTALAVHILSSFLCGSLAGVLVRLYLHRHIIDQNSQDELKQAAFFNFSGFAEPESRDVDPNLLLRFLKNLGRNIRATGGWFLAGIVLSALFQRYVPAEAMTAVFGGNQAFGVLMAATVGVPLYACGGGTIPLLQGWLSDGMSLGSAAAFMITGPATKITNLGAVKIVLGVRKFVLYLVYVMAFSFLAGVAVNVIV